MGNQTQVLSQIQQESKNPLDTVRKNYLENLKKLTGRNVIAYYSGWLHGVGSSAVSVGGLDMQGFMLALHKLDKVKGVDLILHTPGGDIAATEAIVDYLFEFFGKDMRAIIPQQAMSAGTMMALACSSVVMGKHSRLGPIDPQYGGVPSQALLDEFETAIKDIEERPASLHLWREIISKIHPTVLTACTHANEWSKSIVTEWLMRNLCASEPAKAQAITDSFSSHKDHKAHNRQLSPERCAAFGLSVEALELKPDLQDAVLSLHHAYMHTLSMTGVAKIIESSNGQTYMLN